MLVGRDPFLNKTLLRQLNSIAPRHINMNKTWAFHKAAFCIKINGSIEYLVNVTNGSSYVRIL